MPLPRQILGLFDTAGLLAGLHGQRPDGLHRQDFKKPRRPGRLVPRRRPPAANRQQPIGSNLVALAELGEKGNPVQQFKPDFRPPRPDENRLRRGGEMPGVHRPLRAQNRVTHPAVRIARMGNEYSELSRGSADTAISPDRDSAGDTPYIALPQGAAPSRETPSAAPVPADTADSTTPPLPPAAGSDGRVHSPCAARASGGSDTPEGAVSRQGS